MEGKNRSSRSNQQKCQPKGGTEQLIEVPGGGYIVRSTARKDRHSKVYTAKGLRDRRVRLAAHTAIQFYDVQDRLGYERPSKAVDWLIQNAKAAIDRLDELPALCRPPSYNVDDVHLFKQTMPEAKIEEPFLSGSGSGSAGFPAPPENDAAVGSAVKSFQVAATAGSPFPNCTPDHFLPSTSSHVQDLSLSLHSFHEQIFPQAHHNQSPNSSALPTFFAHATNLAQNATWPSGNGGEFMFDMAARQPLQPAHGSSHFFVQREPLQSSNFSCIRAWMDPVMPAAANVFVSGENGGFLGFDNVPARVRGEAEEEGIAYKLHFPSSSSRH